MKNLFALVLWALFLPTICYAQGPTQICFTTNGKNCIPVDAANPFPVSASVSASISGFTALTTGTPISVTTGGVSGTLPLGAVVVATNVGATNGAYCALGASATTSSQYLSPGGGWFAFTVGASTQLTCITSTSTTTVNMTGGSGLPTGTGGGGGGGSGGAVTNAGTFAVQLTGATNNINNISGTISLPTGASTAANQATVTTWAGGTLGAMANYGTSPGTVLVPGVNAFITNTNANGQATMANSSPVVIASNQSNIPVTLSLATSGGYTTSFFQPVASDNHTNLKNGAGQVYWVLAENNSATVNYLRFYNAAIGFNGCNSTTGLITQIQIPASTSVGGITIPLPFGIPFSTGISYCVTSGYATNDTTSATATAMSITIGYN